MFKKIIVFVFIIFLGISFTYGYIEVYTNSYNTINEHHIVGFSVNYSQDDRTLYATLLGKDFEFQF